MSKSLYGLILFTVLFGLHDRGNVNRGLNVLSLSLIFIILYPNSQFSLLHPSYVILIRILTLRKVIGFTIVM